MNDYELGVRLRRQIFTDFERGNSNDGRRYQALLSDFCGERHSLLLPALKHLVQSPGFASALALQPPLPSDRQLLLRLQQELQQVFAAAICQRMDGVLRGLLALPNDGETASSLSAPEAAAVAAVGPGRGGSGLVAVLGFIAGVLVVGVVGALSWLVLLNRQPSGMPSTNTALQQPADEMPQAEPASSESETAEAAPAETNSTSSPDPQQLALEQAITSVRQLYDNLSVGNHAAARALFSPAAADQFDPAFFEQFQRVAVDNLRETGREGSVLMLEGVVSFVYPDGSSQSESRSFNVDTADGRALITGSSFGEVVRPRR
jgi:cell division septation protein DedD